MGLKNIGISQKRRLLIFKVMDGRIEICPYLAEFHRQYRECDDMLEWLIKNKITGQNFIDWVKFYWPYATFLEPARFILEKLHKEKEKRPILLGRDILA